MSADEKQMKLRYAGVCRRCGAELTARTEAIYERSTKTVRCLDCSPAEPAPLDELVESPEPIDIGTPGASARREYERRQAKRETRVREKHPKLGGLILALSDDPQSTMVWDQGANGEETLGQGLNKLASDTLRVLHDRRIPGTRANIDHIAVTPTGIYVIDAKKYKGRPSLKVEGGILRPRVEKLLVGTRDQTKLVDGVLKQVDVVRAIIGNDIPVTGVLCFIEADWPLVGGAFSTRGVEVLWPKKLYPRLTTDGSIASDVEDLHRRLVSALPPA
ncbi:nuclease-related domain-containing protein [Nocardioides sp. URHA0032]|uniref:nuclease-related domain-containing protein n=1 Tax=Nocardioides sp. URHA0032 TaxID=1380388 RepID=UPI0004910EF8|nr:nuclease-related domain-containing protein [Nocardioides sp. URHA0032]